MWSRRTGALYVQKSAFAAPSRVSRPAASLLL